VSIEALDEAIARQDEVLRVLRAEIVAKADRKKQDYDLLLWLEAHTNDVEAQAFARRLRARL
jgi:hypothetical protein